MNVKKCIIISDNKETKAETGSDMTALSYIFARSTNKPNNQCRILQYRHKLFSFYLHSIDGEKLICLVAYIFSTMVEFARKRRSIGLIAKQSEA